MRDADATTPRFPRPVPDAPVAPYAQGTGLAKAWLLELMATLPLADAGRLPAAVLAQEAPGLCRAVCAAIVSDHGLARLGPDGPDASLAARVGPMTGATDAVAVGVAVESLRRVIAAALRSELRGPSGDEVAAIGERLAHVSATVLAAALAVPASAVPAAAEPPDGVVSLHDVRSSRGPDPAAWRTTLERRLERHGRDGMPFALLLVELDDLHILLAAHEADELATAIQGLERAIGGVLRPGDVLVREDPGRYWITLGDTDADAARALAQDIAAAVRAGVVLQGTGLTVSVGVSACPRDGTTLDPLAEHADEGVFLARAAGLPVTS